MSSLHPTPHHETRLAIPTLPTSPGLSGLGASPARRPSPNHPPPADEPHSSYSTQEAPFTPGPEAHLPASGAAEHRWSHPRPPRVILFSRCSSGLPRGSLQSRWDAGAKGQIRSLIYTICLNETIISVYGSQKCCTSPTKLAKRSPARGQLSHCHSILCFIYTLCCVYLALTWPTSFTTKLTKGCETWGY